jgi:hypothetical protein
MKKILTIALALFTSTIAFSQAYNSPESIEFDYANNRWFISNNGSGQVLTRSSVTGARAVFASGITSGPHGLEIVNDTLYVCDGGNIKMYNINTAASLGTIAMGAAFLNGITHDNTYLYATDFSAKKIYRINIATRAFSIYVTGLAKSPNGIIYDAPNNRCVFVNWGTSAPIMALDLTTAATSIITATTLSNCDGIAKDGTGNYYVSSWGLNGISRFNNTFTGGPTTVVTGLSSPADICYNILTDTLGNPNSGALNNTTYHYFGSTTAIDESEKSKFKFLVNPNPIAKTAEIKFELKSEGNVKIELYDVKGQLVKTIANQTHSIGMHSINFDRSSLSAGNYFFTISTSVGTETKKVVIVE